MSVALGVTTMNRPKFASKCLRSISDHVTQLCDAVAIYNDGSDQKHSAEYRRAYAKCDGLVVLDEPVNRGVAVAKNRLLEWMLSETDAEWLMLCEDDIVVRSPKAVTEYVAVAERRGIAHLSFAHHGPANLGGAVRIDGSLSYFPHSIGAWTIFSRAMLMDIGLFDENFHNAWEHVEHELRAIRAGYMLAAGPMCYPDVTGSQDWLAEIPGSIEKSSIRPRSDWQLNIRDGLMYWRDNKPETFEMLFGPGMALEVFATRVLSDSGGI